MISRQTRSTEAYLRNVLERIADRLVNRVAELLLSKLERPPRRTPPDRGSHPHRTLTSDHTDRASRRVCQPQDEIKARGTTHLRHQSEPHTKLYSTRIVTILRCMQGFELAFVSAWTQQVCTK
jgi:hypothetical protein